MTGAGARIGLLDTGAAGDHPVLRGRVADFILFDEAGNPSRCSTPVDTGHHGTHIAGILCGGSFDTRDLGIVPQAMLVVGAVLNGGENVVRILRGLDRMRTSGVQVLCLPFGLPGQNPVFFPLIESIRAAGILPVAAIGNSRSGRSHAPGNYPNVLSVGAIDEAGRPAPFSGSLWHHHGGVCLKPEVLAPGVGIVSAHPRLGEKRRSGTSQACAFVAGVAALLFQAYPDATLEQVEWALTASSRPLDPEHAHRGRYGIVDPEAALELLGKAPPCPPPSLSATSLPQRYVDPAIVETCHRAPSSRVRCVLVAAEDPESAHDLRGPAGRVVDRAEAMLGERSAEVRYLAHGRAAILAAPVRFLHVLMKDPGMQVLSPCTITTNPFS